MANMAANTGEGTGAQAKEKAQEVAGQAQEKAQQAAHQAAGQARVQVRDQIDQRSTQAGEKIATQASDIRTVGDQLRQQGKDGPAKVADQAAERIEKVGSYLTGADADRILDDVESYARSNPWAVVAGGLALGFMASRFLKASSTERYQTRTGTDYYGRQSTRQLPAGYAGDRRFSREYTGGELPTTGLAGTGTGTGLGTTGTLGDTSLETGIEPAPSTSPERI